MIPDRTAQEWTGDEVTRDLEGETRTDRTSSVCRSGRLDLGLEESQADIQFAKPLESALVAIHLRSLNLGAQGAVP
jgi:hypothetical protein